MAVEGGRANSMEDSGVQHQEHEGHLIAAGAVEGLPAFWRFATSTSMTIIDSRPGV